MDEEGEKEADNSLARSSSFSLSEDVESCLFNALVVVCVDAVVAVVSVDVAVDVVVVVVSVVFAVNAVVAFPSVASSRRHIVADAGRVAGTAVRSRPRLSAPSSSPSSSSKIVWWRINEGREEEEEEDKNEDAEEKEEEDEDAKAGAKAGVDAAASAGKFISKFLRGRKKKIQIFSSEFVTFFGDLMNLNCPPGAPQMTNPTPSQHLVHQ